MESPPPPWLNPRNDEPDQDWFLDDEWFMMVRNTADADLRAHRIALTYYHLGKYFDTFLHGGTDASTRQSNAPSVPLNANWFHFAMWGTLTVTQNVTTKRLPQRLNSGIPSPLRQLLAPTILRVRASDGQRVGQALAWGQMAIFGSAVQMVKAAIPGGTGVAAVDENELFAWLQQTLGPSEITLDIARHIKPIKRAFGYYDSARGAPDSVTQAWLILGANILMTAAEQDLADRTIEVVLDHVPQHIGAAIDWRLAKLSARFRGVPPNLAFVLLESMHPSKRKLMYTLWSRLMTDQVLVMSMPTETLRLGRDVPPRHREWPLFPPDLRVLPDVAAHTDMYEIISHVKSLDRTIAGAGTRGSAARDWRRWDERMNWALALIRSRQQDDTLFWSPYSVADQWRIVNGEMPERLGDASTLDVQAPIAANVPRLARGIS